MGSMMRSSDERQVAYNIFNMCVSGNIEINSSLLNNKSEHYLP